MVKHSPRQSLLAKPLRLSGSASQCALFRGVVGTHIRDLVKLARRVNPQNLDCNVATLVFTLPHVSIRAVVHRGIRPIVTEWDSQ